MNEALAALPPRERAEALLVYAESHSHVGAAQILGMPLGTLKPIVARADTALARQLEGVER